MFFSLFTHIILKFILLVAITNIKCIHGQVDYDDTEKNTVKRESFDYSKSNQSLKVPCRVLETPIEDMKTILRELELKRDIYCSIESTSSAQLQTETVKTQSNVETQVNKDQDSIVQNNQPENISPEHEPLGQRQMNYYQPWPHYTPHMVYQHYPSPNYYYPRHPYQHIYQHPSMAQTVPVHPAVEDNFNDVTQEPQFDSSVTTVSADAEVDTNKKKYSRRCFKKKSRRMETLKNNNNNESKNTITESDNDINNDTNII